MCHSIPTPPGSCQVTTRPVQRRVTTFQYDNSASTKEGDNFSGRFNFSLCQKNISPSHLQTPHVSYHPHLWTFLGQRPLPSPAPPHFALVLCSARIMWSHPLRTPRNLKQTFCGHGSYFLRTHHIMVTPLTVNLKLISVHPILVDTKVSSRNNVAGGPSIENRCTSRKRSQFIVPQ